MPPTKKPARNHLRAGFPIFVNSILFSNKEDRDKAYQSRRRYNQCERCGLKGHFIKECPNPGMKRGNKNIKVRVNVPPEKFVKDMYNEKANITYGQIYNENPKYRKIAREYDEYGSA